MNRNIEAVKDISNFKLKLYAILVSFRESTFWAVPTIFKFDKALKVCKNVCLFTKITDFSGFFFLKFVFIFDVENTTFCRNFDENKVVKLAQGFESVKT